jgi:Calcium-binding EGF domain
MVGQVPRCYCPAGRQPNGTQCIDVDECALQEPCEQKCTNTDGSYKCSCVAGYVKIANMCHALNSPRGEQATLMFITSKDLRKVSLTGENTSVLPLANALASEMWHRNRSVCVVNYGNPGQLESRFVCVNVDNMTQNWTMPSPDLFPNLNCK